MGGFNYNFIDGLKVVGYQGDLTSQDAMHTALESGLKSSAYVKLIAWLSNEISTLGKLEEKVTICMEDENQIDTNSFMMELSAFLKELGCPYQFFTTGPMSSRLPSAEARILLIEYLLSELMCFRKQEINKVVQTTQLNLQESSTASTLKNILIVLGFNKPPDNITTTMLFDKLLTKMKEVKNKAGSNRIGKPLLPLNKPINQKQWDALADLQADLENEYKLRRQMLLTRLDVTIQSFQWSERSIGHEDNISRLYTTKRNTINSTSSDINLSHLLAARTDLAILEKTSNANVRKNTKSDIQKLIIGRVPDRGGRPDEHAPPPPEMPSWQTQRATGPQGGGGGRGGGRGGFSQGQQQNRGQYSSGDQGGGPSRVQGQWNQQSSGGGRGGGYSNRGGYNQGNQGGGYSQGNQGGGYSQGSSYSQSKQGGGYSQESSYSGSYNKGGNNYSQGSSYNQDSSYSQGNNYNQSSNYSQGRGGGYKSGNNQGYDNNRGYDNSRPSSSYQQRGGSYNQGNNQQGYQNRGNRY